MVKQTAGRTILGNFAPKFAALNDDVLFGEVWSREEKLSRKLRSIITVSALIGKGMTDASLAYHLKEAKKEWRDAGGNGRTSDAHCFLRWLA